VYCLNPRRAVTLQSPGRRNDAYAPEPSVVAEVVSPVATLMAFTYSWYSGAARVSDVTRNRAAEFLRQCRKAIRHSNASVLAICFFNLTSPM
jgi:hypothetical protein